MNSEQADAEDVRRAIEGRVGALESLYDRHKMMVFSVGLSICGTNADADEVVQETFLRAFRSLSQWRGESAFATWLYSVAVRTAQNWKSRFLARRPILAGREVRRESSESDERLLGAIQDLPEQQRATVLLKHLQGLTIREIAAVQGCAEGTVKARLCLTNPREPRRASHILAPAQGVLWPALG